MIHSDPPRHPVHGAKPGLAAGRPIGRGEVAGADPGSRIPASGALRTRTPLAAGHAPAPAWSVRLAEIRAGRDLPNLVALANRLAGLPGGGASALAQADFVAAMLRRQPGLNPVRLARLAAENERPGWRFGLRELGELALRHGFAAVGSERESGVDSAAPADAGGGSGTPGGDAGRGDTAGQGSPVPGNCPPEWPAPGGGPAWYSLPVRDWCGGGSVRLAPRSGAVDVALDIRLAGGSWQFYWEEPRRDCLAYLPPSGALRSGPDELRRSLAWLPGAEKFVVFRRLTGDEWIDGFNFFDIDCILEPVDLVT